MLIADVPEQGRLSLRNPSYRANVLVPEGSARDTAVVNVDDGALVQPLPFNLKLKKFIVDYYSTGMPSRFASEVEVTDPDTGKSFDATIEVNEPLHFKGVTVYQSSFDDGGSEVELVGHSLTGEKIVELELKARVGQSSDIKFAGPGKEVKADITKLRPINVEDLTAGEPATPKALSEHVASVTGSAAGKKNANLRNVGPSIEYRLTDASGQTTLFHNYMLPVELDGMSVFLAGVQEPGQSGFRYLRIPADDHGSVKEFMLLRAALADPAMRKQAAANLVQNYRGSAVEQKALQTSAERALDTFATGGLGAISEFLERNVPKAEQQRAADIIARLLSSSVAELYRLTRVRAGVAAIGDSPEEQTKAENWSRLAVAALSDLAFYPAPVLFTLKSFDHVQASVFQVSRTPGKLIVYLGCLLLVLGVFTMFYVRDRRIWVWLRPTEHAGGTSVLAAMTSQKRTLDFNREFEQLQSALGRLNPSTPIPSTAVH
jgi:cytochrome c biogenesis protein